MYDVFTKGKHVSPSYKKYSDGLISFTKYYWVIDDSFDFNLEEYKVSEYDEGYTHVFLLSNGSVGPVLYPKRNSKGVKFIETDINHKGNSINDIVFIMNGEVGAEVNLQKLYDLKLPNTIKVVSGINGRNAAYKEAARVSDTDHFFAVFAKIDVNPNFDFSFVPCNANPHHYIYSITNPVNGLEYGHQAIISYNKELVLTNSGDHIDFTLAQPYVFINRNCGIARYNVDPFITWRTAFRECIKLLIFKDNYRLDQWKTGSGEFHEWSIKGAYDAIEFYESVNGDIEQLKLSYDWEWLKTYFNR